MKTTTIKTRAKFLPAALRDAIKGEGFNKQAVTLVVVNDDTFRETTYNTQWDGGTHNAYYTYYFGRAGVSVQLDRDFCVENDTRDVPAGLARVQLSHFCGKECHPAVTVRNADLVAFFGIETPAEIAEMPAEIKADWLCDEADQMGTTRAEKSKAKAYREAAELIRLVCGVPV